MWQVIGQTRAVSLLQRSLERGALAHAYLLAGPAHTGKMTLAVNLAQALNCPVAERPCGECVVCRKIASGGHSDVQVIGLLHNGSSGEAKARAEIGIDQIREMQHFASLPPFEGNCKVFIIDSAESLSTEAANCLLKTLEEPVGRVVFILLAVNAGLLPATVVSRCQQVELRPVPAAEIESALIGRGIEPPKAAVLARLSHGGAGWALSASLDDGLLRQHEEKMDRLVGIITADGEARFAWAAQMAAQFGQDRGAVLELLALWLEYWRDLLLVKIGCPDAVINLDRMVALSATAAGYRLGQIKGFIDSIRAAAEQLRQNASPRLVFEVLMLDMPGQRGQVAEH